MKTRLFGLFFILFCLFNASSALAEEMIEVSVTKGDSLIKICENLLEEPEKWREIATLNRLRDPDLILPGKKLLFPAALLKGVPLDGLVTFIRGRVDVQNKATGEWKIRTSSTPLAVNSSARLANCRTLSTQVGQVA